ncbi:hypothetical protein KW835_12825 [Acidovorax sp. sic0104]|nr:hypothetical protein [Acidovorax sp. sic0104]
MASKTLWAALVFAALPAGPVAAQIRDGSYSGTLQCGDMVSNPSQKGWTHPVRLTVSGRSVAWERLDDRLTERGSAQLQKGRVTFKLDGQWNPGQRSTGQWRNEARLELKGSTLSGPATIYAAGSDQRLRDCSVQVAVTTASPSGTPPGGSAETKRSPNAVPAAGPAQSAHAAPDAHSSDGDAIRREHQRRHEERLAQTREEQKRRGERTWEEEQADYQRQLQERRKASEDADRKRNQDFEREQERAAQERAASAAKQTALGTAAAGRQAARIKAMGLSATLSKSVLYVNYMGRWTEFMPATHWVALMLENPLIASVEAANVRGYPGILVKRSGVPSTTFLFRTEGSEAYIHALASEGKAEALRTPTDFSTVAALMRALTDQKNMR